MADDPTLRFYAENAAAYATHVTSPTGARLDAFLADDALLKVQRQLVAGNCAQYLHGFRRHFLTDPVAREYRDLQSRAFRQVVGETQVTGTVASCMSGLIGGGRMGPKSCFGRPPSQSATGAQVNLLALRSLCRPSNA